MTTAAVAKCNKTWPMLEATASGLFGSWRGGESLCTCSCNSHSNAGPVADRNLQHVNSQLALTLVCCCSLAVLLPLCILEPQVISPFVDAVTRSKVEFVTTSEYEPSKAGKDTTSSSWFGSSKASSWFSSSKSSSTPQKQQRTSTDGDSSDADVDIVVEDQGPVKGPGTFGPMLSFYKTPFNYDRHQQLLSAAGLA